MANYLEIVKEVEIAKVLIGNYGYKEIIYQNVEGIFLINPSANFQLVHLNNNKFTKEQDAIEYVAKLKVLVNLELNKNYSNDIKLLNINVEENIIVEDTQVVSINLTDDKQLDNEIVNTYFPLIKSKVSFEKINSVISAIESKKATKVNQSNGLNSLLSKSPTYKQTVITRLFLSIFIVFNIISYNLLSPSIFSFALYQPLVNASNQWYRYLTSVLVGHSFFNVMLFYFFISRLLGFIEVSLGRLKTIVFILVSILLMIVSSYLLAANNVVYGLGISASSFIGAFIGVVYLRKQKTTIKIAPIGVTIYGLCYITIIASTPANFILCISNLLMSFILVLLLQLKEDKIKSSYALTILSALVLMFGTKFFVNQQISRDLEFERTYLEEVSKYKSSANSKEIKKQLDDYFKKLGYVSYE